MMKHSINLIGMKLTYGTENTIRTFLTKFEFANAKLEELEKWKSNYMYEAVSNEGQDCISLR